MKKIFSILLIGVIAFGLTGCGNNQKNSDSNSQNQNKQETTEKEDKKEKINKEITCTYKSGYTKTLSIIIKDSKATKFTNTLTYTGDLNTWCKEVHSRYDKLNDVKGASQNIVCDENSYTTKAELTWIINEIDDFDSLVGDQVPEQLQFMNRETKEFYFDWFLEAMGTQNYTCEEN